MAVSARNIGKSDGGRSVGARWDEWKGREGSGLWEEARRDGGTDGGEIRRETDHLRRFKPAEAQALHDAEAHAVERPDEEHPKELTQRHVRTKLQARAKKASQAAAVLEREPAEVGQRCASQRGKQHDG